MKKNKIERRIFEAADRLTPEPRPFETVTKGVDWDAVAAKCHPSKRRHRILIPVAIASLALSIAAAIAVPLAIHFSNKTSYYGGGGERAIVFGNFVTQSWQCSDPSIDLSAVSLDVLPNKVSPINGVALLFNKDGSFACSVSFVGEPFSAFEYSSLQLTIGEYCGTASLLDARFYLAMSFSTSESKTKTIDITFGDPSSSPYYGNLTLRHAE